MKFCSKLLAIFAITLSCALTSCAGPSSFSYQNVTLTITPYQICNGCFTGSFYYLNNPAGAGGVTGAIEMPPGGGSGGCIELQANVTNAPVNPTWTVLPVANPSTPGAGSGTTNPPTQSAPNFGTVSSPSGATNFYCEPSGIPIYTGAALAQAQALGLPQGTTEVLVTNPADPNNPSNVVSASLKFAFQVQTPPTGVNVGFSGLAGGSSVVVPLNGTYQFNGYVAGINGFNPCTGGGGGGTSGVPAYGLTYYVNNVLGGVNNPLGNFGTISATGLYTAPASYPSATVKTASITVASLACPTIIGTAVAVNFP